MHRSTSVREASSWSRWSLTERHNRTVSREWETLEHSVLNRMSLLKLSSRLRDLCKRGGIKTVRARGGGGLPGGSVFLTHWDWYSYDITEIVTLCTEPVQIQAGQIPEPRGGGGHKILPLIQKLFAIDTFWGRENHFSLVECYWAY